MLVTRRALVAAAFALPVGGTVLRPALAGETAIFAPGGAAISGYDPVAYFTEGRPVPGQANHALMWRGATWFFDTAAAMETFEMNPAAYAPQYGGYCAYSMSMGALSPSVPEAFTVYRGRLYLYSSVNARATWSGDISGNLARADANWPTTIAGQ